MQEHFDALLKLIQEPLSQSRSVRTDDSILMVYPPNRELDFREYLKDTFVPQLEAEGVAFKLLDLSGFVFEILTDKDLDYIQKDEFSNYGLMKRGLSQRVERGLQARLRALAAEVPGGAVLVFATVALYPLVKFGDVLGGLRDAPARLVVAFPGEERGGKLHFMNQPDGGNYLAIRL